MEIDFDKLINLQRLDSEIQSVDRTLNEIPRYVDMIEKRMETTSQVLTQVKEKLTQNQKKRRELEAEVKDLKVVIGKYKRQLNDVKTNKEYTALLKEIEETQHKINCLEEGIIIEMITADEIEADIKAATQKKNQEQDTLLKEKQAIQIKARELEEKKAQLLKEKEALLQAIPEGQVRLYLNLCEKKEGRALSQVKGEFCSQCYVRIRPQMINEIRELAKIILCENCGRILFWVEDKEPDASTETAKS